MIRKNWIQISTVLTLVLIAQVGLMQEAASFAESLRDIAPDKPLVFCQLTGLSSIVKTDSNLWKQLAQAPFWELVYAELEAQSKVKDIHLAVEPGASLLSYIFGEDIVFVLPQFQQITEVSPLLMLRLRDSDDTLGAVIASGIKIALANVAQTTWQYGGYTVATIAPPKGAPFGLSCAVLDDVLAVGLGDMTLKRVIDLVNGSEDARAITKDAEFSAIMERMPLPDNSKTGQHLGVFHLDLARIVAFGNAFYPFAQENIPQEVRPIVEKALKWSDLVSSISSTVSITDEGLVSQGYLALNPDATSQNLLEMLQAEPEQLGSIMFAPEDAIGYSGSNLVDIKVIWKMAHDALSDLPKIGEQMLGGLEQLQSKLEFNFEEGLLSWMGNEVGFIYSEIPALSPKHIPEGICLVIEVIDKEKASQGMREFTEIGVRLSEGQMAIQAQEYSGETIYELGNLPVPIKPGYALVGDYMLISPSSAYIQKLIDCASGRGKGLEANPRFQSVKDRLPTKVNSIQFSDPRRYVEAIIYAMKTQAGEEMPSWEDENLDLGATVMLQVLELAELLSQAFGASIGFTVSEGTGLKSNSFVLIKDLETVVPITDPDVAKVARSLHIADKYKRAGMMDRALARYMQVLELSADNWQAALGAAQVLSKQGDTQRAEEYWARTGMVPEDAWYVIGPFQNENGEGFYTKYPPEESIQLDAEYEGKEGTVRWEKQADDNLDGFVDFRYIFEPDQWAVGYAWTKVLSGETREVQLRVGSDDQVIVWLNGEEVMRYEEPRPAEPDQDVIPVTLNQGENQLLVKVCNEQMEWGFYLRLTDAEGRPLRDLEHVR